MEWVSQSLVLWVLKKVVSLKSFLACFKAEVLIIRCAKYRLRLVSVFTAICLSFFRQCWEDDARHFQAPQIDESWITKLLQPITLFSSSRLLTACHCLLHFIAFLCSVAFKWDLVYFPDWTRSIPATFSGICCWSKLFNPYTEQDHLYAKTQKRAACTITRSIGSSILNSHPLNLTCQY